MKETERFVQGVIKEVTGLPSHGERPHRAGDYAFNNIGVSSLFMLSSTMKDEDRAAKGYYTVGGCGGNIAWHTENDTIDIADKTIMVRDIKVYLGSVMRIANAEVLPFDWRDTVKEFQETIDKYQKAAGNKFSLAQSRTEADALLSSLEKLYGAIEQKRVPAGRANAAIKDLMRILIPINYTKGPRFRHDPATPIPALPTIATATELDQFDDNKLGFAKTQLTRGQNRLVAALREAKRITDAAMA